MMQSHAADEFVTQLTDVQGRLFGYILSLLPQADVAHDVLQETNLELWRKRESFEPGTDFMAWACRLAYFAVLRHVRDKGRDRHHFDEQLIDDLAPAAQRVSSDLDTRLEALRRCMENLPEAHRRLLHQRYHENIPVQRIAEMSRRSRLAVSQSLFRIRAALLKCIDRARLEHRP